MVIQTYKRSCLSKPFGSQRVSESQKLLESAEKHFYRFFVTLSQIDLGNFYLLKSETLWLLVKTLTAEYEYSWSNRENLLLSIQMQWSKKVKTFCQFFITFLESTLNIEHSINKNKPHSLSISEIINSEKRSSFNA